jgi:hypothetical protein
MSYLEELKERYFEEVNENVLFYDNKGNQKIEEISGKDFNQFESLCDLLASDLGKRWSSKVDWRIDMK